MVLLIFTGVAQSQTRSDKEQILQLCIDLPGLQEHFSADERSGMKPVNIMNMPNDLLQAAPGVSKFGNQLAVVDRGEISNRTTGTYLVFHKTEILDDYAKVNFAMTTRSESGSVRKTVELILKKSGDQWIITSSTIE